MRTTFTPEPDLEPKLRELARKSKKSLNSVINDAVRAGLNGAKQVEPKPEFVVPTFALHLREGIDPLKLREVLYDLDVEERWSSQT